MIIKPTFRHKVEDGIPLPPSARGRKPGGATWTYPFELMSVGQSFLIPKDDAGYAGVSKIANAINGRYKKEGCYFEAYAFRIRTMENGGEEGIRVWRIK